MGAPLQVITMIEFPPLGESVEFQHLVSSEKNVIMSFEEPTRFERKE
jgi:hypothetical protein